MKKRKLLLSTLAAAVFATSAGALVACGDGLDLPNKDKQPPATDTGYTVTFVAGVGAKLVDIQGSTLTTDKDGHLTAATMPKAEKTADNDDYTFLGWGLAAGATVPAFKDDNYKTYVFDEDTSVYAVFKENDGPGPVVTEYDITFANGLHGTVSKTTVKTTNGGNITEAMLPTVTPEEGWRHTGWTMDGAAVTFPKTFTATATVTAVYEEIGNVEEQEYDITFANGLHGTVSETMVTTVDGVITAAMLPTVTPEEGWRHTGWEIDGVAATFPKTFTATATVTAVYEEIGEPDPDLPVVSVKNGETEIALEDNSALALADYEFKLANGETTIHLTQGDVLTILIDGQPPENFNLYNSHGATYSGNTVTITATGDFTFYLRYYENTNWWNLEINDGETDELHVGHYYLVGAGFGWSCTAGGYMGETAGEIDLTVGDASVAFKVVKCENESGIINWDENTVVLGPADVTTGSGYVTTDDTGNIVLATAGTYTVKLVGGKLEITSDDVDEPIHGGQGGTYKVGATGTEVALTVKSLTTEEQNSGMLAQYWIDTVQFETGDKLYFAIDGAAIQFEVESASSGVNTPEGTNNTYLEIKKGGTFKIYIKKFADKWQIYAGREISPDDEIRHADTVEANNVYLVGNVDNTDASWDNWGTKGFKLTKRTDGMYEIIMAMTSGDNFKFILTQPSTASVKTWIGTIGSSNVSAFIGTASDNLSIKADGNFYFIVDASAAKVYVSYSAVGDPAAPRIEAPIEGGAYLVGSGFANAAWSINPSNYIDPENGLEVTFTTSVQFKCLNCKNGKDDWAYNSSIYYECRNSEGAFNGLNFNSIGPSGNGSVATPGRYKVTIEQKDGHILFVFTYLGAA